MKNILLTGSRGFIGHNLKDYLSKQWNLYTPTSSDLNLLDNLAVKNFFNENHIDYIIHCSNRGGTRGIIDDVSIETENRLMLDNLLKYKKRETKIMVFGSGAQYDKSRNLHKVKESELYLSAPKDHYGRSKLEMAKLALNRDDILCLTIFGCYGKYEKTSRFPTYAIEQNNNNKQIIIQRNSLFDYLYIDDLCKIVEHFLIVNPKSKIINVTPTESISMIQIAEYVNQISNHNVEIIVENTEFLEYTGDNTCLLNELPDFKFTSYQDGLYNLMQILKKKNEDNSST